MQVLKMIVTDQSQGNLKISLNGPIDTYTHENLDYFIEKTLNPSYRNVILDMHKVNYISSMGVGSLFKIRKFTKQNSMEFMIVGLQPQVKMVLDTVQAMPAEAIFKSVEEMDEYLNALQKKAKEKDQNL